MADAPPDPAGYGSLLDLLDDAADRYGDRPMLSLHTEDGRALAWSAVELRRRARLAAWRLRALGMHPGDRLLTWSPPTPELPAIYFAAMLAGVVVVPLDLRMAAEVSRRIAERAGTGWLALGRGRDCPDPSVLGLDELHTLAIDQLVGDERPAESLPADWTARLAAWPRPDRETVWEIVFTSGTTGHPRGVMLSHGNILATLQASREVIPVREHRVVSLLPLSHLFGQLELVLVLYLGARLSYVRSTNPRVIFDAIREQRVTTMVVVPQLLELFWRGLAREAERRGRGARLERARRVARRLPYPLRRLLFRELHAAVGGGLRLFVCSAAYLAPRVQQAWQDIGVTVMQGYGATECGFATAQTESDHAPGRVGRPRPPVRVRIADQDGEILVAGPTVFGGYWDDPAATADVLDPDGWYHTGDVGRWDARGELVLSGRTKNMIVLPNGFNVFPEDVENELLAGGLAEAVVVETAPGRIEAVVLPLDPASAATQTASDGARPTPSPERRREVEAAIRAANAALGINQRLAGHRYWPDADFPRTHTLKIRRDLVARWATSERGSAARTSG